MSDAVVGNIIEVPITVTITSTGALVDPSTLQVTLTAPNGTQTTTIYPDTALIRTSLGLFVFTFEADDDGRWYWEAITTGAGAGAGDGYFDVRPPYSAPSTVPDTTYATVQDLRDELGVDDGVLSDRKIALLINDAEDLIDQELGARLINDETGRRVTPTEVDSWRMTKLTRATVLLAVALYRTPDAFNQQWKSVRGPDFAFSGPIGSNWPQLVTAALDASGLRRLTTVASVRAGRRGWRGVLLDDGTWDDDEVWDTL